MHGRESHLTGKEISKREFTSTHRELFLRHFFIYYFLRVGMAAAEQATNMFRLLSLHQCCILKTQEVSPFIASLGDTTSSNHASHDCPADCTKVQSNNQTYLTWEYINSYKIIMQTSPLLLWQIQCTGISLRAGFKNIIQLHFTHFPGTNNWVLQKEGV